MKIKKLLKQRNLAQKDLAEMLGVTSGAISQMLSVGGNPSLATLRKIAELLGVSVHELFDDAPALRTVVCPCCGKQICVAIEEIGIQVSVSPTQHDDIL